MCLNVRPSCHTLLKVLIRLEGFRESLSQVGEWHVNHTDAVWHDGDTEREVFIIQKTERDTREIDFLKDCDHFAVLKLHYYEIKQTKHGK